MTDRIASPTALARPGNRADRRRVARKVAQLLAQREERYPVLVADGKMAEADAARGLALLRALAEQWRWAIDPAAPPHPDKTSLEPFGADELALAVETRTIAARARALSDRTPDDVEAAETADLCEVIAWWQHIDSAWPRLTLWIATERAVPENGCADLARAA